MAVTITNKFYQASAWKDLSKIVFTSPNMPSPSTAGTRSHIFPGQADLGLWYEDLSNMYRIEALQEADESTYFGYSARLYDVFDLDNPSLHITISGVNATDWIEYIRETVNKNYGSWPMHYDEATENTDIYCELSYSTISGSSQGVGNPASSIITSDGWSAGDSSEPQWVAFDLASAAIADYIEFSNINSSHNINEFIFQGKANPGDGYSDLISDSMPGDFITHSFSFVNNDAYKYYRLYVISCHFGGETQAAAKNFKAKGFYEGDITLHYATSSGVARRAFLGSGWNVDEVGTTPHWVRVEFPSSKRITRVSFQNYSSYDVKDFKIQACTTASGVYTDLYSGRALVNTSYKTPTQNFTFSNLNSYKFYRLYFYSRYAASNGYGIKDCKMYGFDVDESVTEPITLYFDSDNIVDISHANNADNSNYEVKLAVDSVTGSGIMPVAAGIYGWGWPGWDHEEYYMLELQSDPIMANTYIRVDEASTVNVDDVIHILNTGNNFNSEIRTVTSVTENPTEAYDTIGFAGGLAYHHGKTTTEITICTPYIGADVINTNSDVFSVTFGECYDCRLTAWDDVTHSSTLNEIIAGNHCRVSALVFSGKTDATDPSENSGVSFVYPPVYNNIFRGNMTVGSNKYYYGDFDMIYRDPGIYGSGAIGDYLIFKPMLYGIHGGISYGVHDFLITLHYSYT